MYIVKLDNKKIYDQRIDELTLIEPVVALEENNAGSFSFTITSTHPNFNDIKRRKSLIQVFEDSELIFSGMVYEVEEDFYKNRKVYCEGELSYLNDTIQRPAEYHNMTARGLIEAYIQNHNAQVEPEKQFMIGMVTVHETNPIECYTNMQNTINCIKTDLLDNLGGIIRVRYADGSKYIDYITENDTRTNLQVIRLGENLINYKSNISSLDIATAIIPLGKKLEDSPIESLDVRLDIKSVNGGLDYVSDSVAVNTFGWIYKTISWDDIDDATILKQKGEQYLNDTQFDNMVIEVNALDMHLMDAFETAIRLSDKIRIVSKPHGLKDKYFRLTKQSINLNSPDKNTITLGKEEHISLSARTVQANNEVLKAMERITPASTILKQAKDNASAIINGNGENGYVVLHENSSGVVYEILVMDTPNINTATKVWRWNENGLGFANSKDTSGNWNFGLAMTMDGAIVADYITTGTLTGLEINNGNGTFKVDSSGNLTASSGTFSGTVSSGTIQGCTISGSGTLNMDVPSGASMDFGTSAEWSRNCVISNASGSGGFDVLKSTSSGRNSVDMHYDNIEKYDSDGNTSYAQFGSSSSSDIRLKENIKNINIDTIRKLFEGFSFKTFRYKDKKDDSNTHYGLIAQDVIELLKACNLEEKEYVEKNDEGYYSLLYSNLERLGLIAIQDLYKTISKQQREIDDLKRGEIKR